MSSKHTQNVKRNIGLTN